MAEPELVTIDETTTAVVRGTITMDEMANFYDSSFQSIGNALTGQSLEPIGPAFGFYYAPPGETVELEVGLPTARPVQPEGRVEPSSLPAGRVARLIHHGAFNGLGGSWQRLGAWIAEQGLTPAGSMWEVYVIQPRPDMNPNDLRTELNWPVR